MALKGAGDPRWVVREREDGRNVNSWHWEDKDVSAWAKDRLKALLTPTTCTATDECGTVSVQRVESVDGDATLYNRKGVLKVLYDLKISGKWTSNHTDKAARTEGSFKLELFDEDPEVLVTLDAKSRADKACRELFLKRVVPDLQSQCRVFVKELRAGAGQALDGVALPAARNREADTAVPDFQRAAMAAEAAAPRKRGGTTEVRFHDTFTCAPADLFLALTEPGRLQAITRARVVSEAVAGGRLELLDGAAVGRYEKVVQGEEVGMEWRLRTWGDGAAAGKASLKMSDEEGKTRLDVCISSVPTEHASGTEGFWRVQILQAIKLVMGWGNASRFL